MTSPFLEKSFQFFETTERGSTGSSRPRHHDTGAMHVAPFLLARYSIHVAKTAANSSSS